MAANNEVGTLNPIGAIGQLCHARGILFHTDATQAVGKVPLDVRQDGDRPAQPLGAQVLRPEGDRCAVRPPARPAGPPDAAARRRRPRARVPERDDRRAAGRRPGRGRGPGRDASGREESARLRGLRERLHAGLAARVAGDPAQRPPDAPAAGQPEPELRRCRRRGADDGHARRGRQLGVGLHVGQPRAEPRADGDGPATRTWPAPASGSAWGGSPPPRRSISPSTPWPTPSRGSATRQRRLDDPGSRGDLTVRV